MCPGLKIGQQPGSENPTLRKTGIIASELSKLRVDICGLQETRLPDTGTLREKEYTFFWKGRGIDDHRLHGVGFAISNRLLQSITTPVGVSERVMTLRLDLGSGYATIVCVYAPTLNASQEDHDSFYGQLEDTLKTVPKHDDLWLLGDFNARVGSDNATWPRCLGNHGVGTMNASGQRLLEFCGKHQMCVTNTWFTGKPQHKQTWYHPRSKTWHMLDMVLTKRKSLNTVKNTRAYHSADCDTDHVLVISTVRPTRSVRQYHHATQNSMSKLEVLNTKVPERVRVFEELFRDKLSENELVGDTPDARWKDLGGKILESATEAFETKVSSKPDWMAANAGKLDPLLEKKRTARKAYMATHGDDERDSLRAAKAELQREIRACANSYWRSLCDEIQEASARGDARTMYDKIKEAMGPQPTKCAAIKAVDGSDILDRAGQMERWVEHYSGLYGTAKPADPCLTDCLEDFPVMGELDKTPTIEELDEAIRDMKCGKACGEDGIPAEILQCTNGLVREELYKLLVMIWESGVVPMEMRHAKIVTLYKNKGDRGDVNNYRGISLLSVAGKAFARVFVKRLQVLGERILPESQCGFRSGRSTMDMIFTLRQLREKCREQNRPLYISYVDLTKAFDTVSRDALWQVLRSTGCPPKLLAVIQSFHADMHGSVQFDGQMSNPFEVNVGVKQGCVLAPTLFGIYFAALLRHAFREESEGVFIRSRADGSLFNVQRLRSRTVTSLVQIRDLLFADDAALTSHSNEGLQRLMDSLEQSCKIFGLQISTKKTEVMGLATPEQPKIKCNGVQLQNVESFTYLGSTIAASLDVEIEKRIAKASGTFGRLTSRVWTNRSLTLKTKLTVYRACVLSQLLYAAETWTTSAKQVRKLNAFHVTSLRKIMGISWKAMLTHDEILHRAGFLGMNTILAEKRLRWLGHVERMSFDRIPKVVLYGELKEGKRSFGGVHKRFKDLVKQDLKNFGLDPNHWTGLASDRSKWRAALREGKNLQHGSEVKRRAAKRLRDKEKQRRLEESKRVEPASRRNPAYSHIPLVANSGTVWSCAFCALTSSSRIGMIKHTKAKHPETCQTNQGGANNTPAGASTN